MEDLYISDEVLTEKSQQVTAPKQRVASALLSLQRECEDRLWNVRYGKADDAYIVYDSNDLVVMGFLPGAWPTDPTLSEDALEGAYDCHHQTALFWAHDREIHAVHEYLRGDNPHLWVFFEPQPEDTWRHEVQTNLRWYEPIEYEVNFVYPKWSDFDASIFGCVEIPGEHGTLRKEYKLQGFPTHRTPSDGIWETTTITHIETETCLSEENDEFQIPSAESFETYPHLPHLQRGVYGQLFGTNAPEYRALIESEVPICPRCGTYEHAEPHTFIEPLPNPETPSRTQEYCTGCYERAIQQATGVTRRVARIFTGRQMGLETDTLCDWLDTDAEFVTTSIENVQSHLPEEFPSEESPQEQPAT